LRQVICREKSPKRHQFRPNGNNSSNPVCLDPILRLITTKTPAL
jgi:hypothetical protein